MDWDEMPGYMVKLALDGTNYRVWAFVVRTHLSAHGLWEYITGKSACPPAPVPPPQSPPGAKEVADAASKASKDYQQALDAYNHLPTESAQKMWTYLQKRYKPIVEAVRYTSLQKLQALRQNDESIEDFFDHFMDLWSNIEFSGTLSDDCGVCTCCRKLKEHNDKRCLYEFLICLRPEFATSKDLLLFRDPQPTVFEALGDLRVAEIRLQLQSMSKPSTAVIQCNHCRNFGHTYQKCTMRKNRRGRHFFYHGRKGDDTSELQTRAQYFFSLKEIESATKHFDPANKIGEGGFGPVYKGTLADGTTVAVKKLSSKSSQGNREFLNEIGIISALRHQNLAGRLKQQGRLLEIVDPCLGSDYSQEQAQRLLNIALLCTNSLPTQRPRMSSVVKMIRGQIPIEVMPDDDMSEDLQLKISQPHDSVSNTQTGWSLEPSSDPSVLQHINKDSGYLPSSSSSSLKL
ncbi:hypothetical protein PR202_ga06982 [Eleusine coracana subsp. coracana]|uniref:Protein kinase domain-containing protein n=1 Tax=Eleusine coracana subsp. coracana TaxID=191504 RepID=A0AAV5BY47_ELECO|nr:hypothetical protein PR202_ga06982 [Eleusine coracana subsp. coracana]